MKKKITALLLLVTMMLTLFGCGKDPASSVTGFLKGDVTGEMNKTYSTKWFDFTVKSIKTAYEYDGYVADDDYKFVIVAVSETCTFEDAIPMGHTDFNLEAEGLSEYDGLPFDLDEAEKAMPFEFWLEPGESTEGDVIFMIPEEITEINFVYEEVDEDLVTHATFRIKHTL